jgi:asparagine synthase (glutamine-hydrolysing)
LGGEPRPVVSAAVLDRMTDMMVHRGPDDRGTYLAPGVALGVRRLSIVDVEGGHQPVFSEDQRICAIQNGELYNHLELRDELSGHRYGSRCDTEVLPHLYEEFGRAFPERLRGKFGIAVWDASRRQAVLARDRLGVKPLYWSQQDDVLIFASELKSVLASGLIETALDYDALDTYLTLGFIPAPRTPLRGIWKLLPGHRLVADREGVHLEAYWSYPAQRPDPNPQAEREYAEELLAVLEEAVRLRLMSDVPLGAMLSGGLDSSLVVALMARNMSEPVKTFSVGFREDRESNELADARFIASAYGTDHHELELSYHEQSLDLADLVWHLDEPLASLSALGFLALSRLAAQHVTVALSGQGADELLGGYERHRTAAFAAAWARIPRRFRSAAEHFASKGGPRLERRASILAASDPAERYLAVHRRLGPLERAELVRGPLSDLDGRSSFRAVASRLTGVTGEPLPAMLSLDAQLGLPDDMLHYFDRASMAESLEVRVPFLDHRVVEYCARIPSELKVRRMTTKYLLKRAARGVVPDRIVDKPKIGFFHRAVGEWSRSQAIPAIKLYLLDPSPRYAEFLDVKVVRRLVADHEAGKGGRPVSDLVMELLMLEIWLASYLPRATAREEPVATHGAAPAATAVSTPAF